ncbi:MAG: MotA/TolQ/ExbB proton channel family protein [Thermoguttaceae bacterium]
MNVICSNRRPLFYAATLLALACWGLASAAVPAEPETAKAKAAEAAPPQAPAAPAAKHDALGNTEQVISIGRVLFEKTNWLGWMFYAAESSLSIMAMTVVLERLVNLRRRKLMPGRFVRRLRDLIARREDSLEHLRTLCESSETPIGNVLRAGVIRAGRPLPEVEKAMEDAALREAGAQRSRNRMLGVIATVAPMVGLLGTVVGMILAFRVTSQAGTGKAELLAEGIYLALLRTAFGLLIAVPSLMCAHWFNTRVDRYLREMIDLLEETIPTFAGMERSAESNGEPLRAVEPPGRMKRV